MHILELCWRARACSQSRTNWSCTTASGEESCAGECWCAARHHLQGGNLASAAAGISGHGHRHWGSDYTTRAIFVRLLALGMMAIAIIMALYAAFNFRKRGRMLLCAAPQSPARMHVCDAANNLTPYLVRFCAENG